MPHWKIVGALHVVPATPDEVIAWVKAEIGGKLAPGEEGGAWRVYGKGKPSAILGAIRRVVERSPVPQRGEG